jgi:uncharacterized damage-inducible protein DinB
MRYRAIFLLLAVSGLAAPAVAQTTDGGFAEQLSPSMAATAKSLHATIRRNIAEAAAAMTAEDYTFQPTPQVRTFARLVGHVITGNYFFCAMAKGERPPETANYEKTPDRGDLLKALTAALAYCDDVYSSTTDANYTAMVQVPNGQQTSRGSVLVFNTTHNNEHYGNMVVYMRLKGRTPPSTARVGRP